LAIRFFPKGQPSAFNRGRAGANPVGLRGYLVLLMGFCVWHSVRCADAGKLGIFEGQSDVGVVQKAGSAELAPSGPAYLVNGGGENMWFTNDAFHFVWTRVSGDFAFEAAIQWQRAGGNPHRKACLLVRQTLEPGSPYVDVAAHGNGLLSLQFRDAPGGLTHEIQVRQPAPAAGEASNPASELVGLTRQGEVFFITQTQGTAPAKPLGAFTRLKFTDPVYVGLGVCAHDAQGLETARFTRVQLRKPAPSAAGPAVLHCALETVDIASKDRRLRFHTTDHIEAPNWTKDGRFFLFNSGGRILRLPVQGGVPIPLDTGFAQRCNNDHGLSPDGAWLAISDQSQDGKSRIYIVPERGGTSRQLTPLGPSYWHGWAPQGSTVAYCAERNGEFDVYTIPVVGGQERRLTTAPGLDDGPDYSPDGKFIYFNSERTGTMQIWRMHPDGSDQEQLTSDSFNNWFPHPSPDGRWLVFLSYEHDVKGHPANQPVRLRLMPIAGGPLQELARLFGGQGTMNVPSWSPDSRQVAFVSYELLGP
jgi:TolB protein